MNYWWITTSEWHWSNFFENPEEYDWGGADWIKSSLSRKRVGEMRQNDLIVAYQAKEGIIGLAYLAADGDKSKSSFRLKAAPIVYLNQTAPLKLIRKFPEAKKHIEFLRILRGTVFYISPQGFRMIQDAILESSREQRKEIKSFLKNAKTQKPAVSFQSEGRELEDSAVASSVLEPPKRISVEITRVVRDTAKTRRLKKLHEYRCQICNQRIEISSTKFYAEVHHVRPLGGKHKGLDKESNMIVVCPSHHAYFDFGVPRFLSAQRVKIGKEIFELSNRHGLDKDNLDYHNEFIFGSNA